MRKLGNTGWIVVAFGCFIISAGLGVALIPENVFIIPAMYITGLVAFLVAKFGLTGWFNKRKIKETHREVLSITEGILKIEDYLEKEDIRLVNTRPRDGIKKTKGQLRTPFWVIRANASKSRQPPMLMWIVCDLSSGEVFNRDGSVTEKQLDDYLENFGPATQYISKIEQPSQPSIILKREPLQEPQEKEGW